MPLLFVLSQSIGILCADAGWTPSLIIVAAIVVGAAACILRLGRAGSQGAQVRRWDAWIALSLLAFLLGFYAHAQSLERAARDAERLSRIDSKAEFLVDAIVDSRRGGRFGDRVRLSSLRSVLTGEELVRSAEMRLMAAAAEADTVVASRADRLLWPGAAVRLGLRLSRSFSTRNPGSPDWDRQRARSGLVARARLVDPDWVIERVATEPWRLPLGRMRAVLEQRRHTWQADRAKALGEVSSGQALARALVLGDRTGLTEKARDAFRETGLGHLLAVSGLHVGFVAAFAAWLSKRAAPGLFLIRAQSRRRSLNPFAAPIWTGAIAAASYAWMTGAAVSVARASLLLCLFVLARQGGRNIRPVPALACIAAGLLWMQPAMLFDLGARFSFSACLALAASSLWGGSTELALSEAAPEKVSVRLKIGHVMRGAFAASLAVSFGTLPWVAEIGGPLHGLSPFLNVLAIPWTGLLVLPTSMLGVVGAGRLPSEWVAGLLWPASVLARSVEWVAETIPSLPVQFEIPFLGILYCAVLGVLLVRKGALFLALMLWWIVAIAGVSPSLGEHFETSLPRAVFFDVGQGDATLIQTESSTWLVDTGPGPQDGSGGAVLARGISALGVRRIDILVVTHADLDHRAGAKRVLETFSVGALWLPATGRNEEALRTLGETARRHGTRVRRIHSGSSLVSGPGPGLADSHLQVDVLWPRAEAPKPMRSRNESSLVLRFRFVQSGRSLLMTADVGHATERRLLEAPAEIEADVLKVGHHGSRGSTSAAFLDAVAPEWVILSAPCEPSRGLPAQSVLGRLRAADTRLAWTGRDGAVVAEFGTSAVGPADAPGPIRVRSWASPRSCAEGRRNRGR